MNGFSTFVCDGSLGAPGNPIVYGRDVLVRQFLEIFWRHGSAAYYDYYVRHSLNGDADMARDALRKILTPCANKQARILSIEELKANFASFTTTVWHDFDAELMQAISMRGRLSQKLFPAAATVHVLSYQSLLGDWILPMLLGDVQPCDALVSTTTSCRSALRNIMQHVRVSVRERHGVDLPFRGELPVIPCPVDVEVFQPRDKQAARVALGLPFDAFIIGWVGRVSAIDKADLTPLLQVFARLVRANHDRQLLLLIAGGGEESVFDSLRKFAELLEISDNVQWLQPLPPEQRAQVFTAIDIFTSPVDNVQETAGITPLEALASGVPQVVSDWNGYRETVEHCVTGFCVPTLWKECDKSINLGAGLYDNYNLMDHFALAQSVVVDPDAYLYALQQLLDHSELRQSMSENSRRRAVSLYAPQRIVHMYEELWEELRRIADATPWTPLGGLSHDTPAWHRNFRHYASADLSGNTRIQLTYEGQIMAQQIGKLAIHAPFPLGLTAHGLGLTMMACDKPEAFANLSQHVASMLNIGTDLAVRNLLWLLKHAYVMRIPEDTTSK